MSRVGFNSKQVRKADPRMPFSVNMQDLLTGYLSPQLHKNLRLMPVERRKKASHE